jgi:hypothetical protein
MEIARHVYAHGTKADKAHAHLETSVVGGRIGPEAQL